MLNAKNHEKEAEIVAQAGKLGAVTVATNMAGRGTDIMLGGNAEYLAKADLRKAGYCRGGDRGGHRLRRDRQRGDPGRPEAVLPSGWPSTRPSIKDEAEKVRAAGGLFIIGTERHESRRIDNQLRGRAGRQGDPGETRFYLSLEDDLMRLFGGDRIQNMMEKLDLDEDTPIENKMLTGAIENAQTTVESRNFQSRKNVLEYDDVMNKQREIIYAQRRQVLDGEDLQGDRAEHDAHHRQPTMWRWPSARISIWMPPSIMRCSRALEGYLLRQGRRGILRRGDSLQDPGGLRRGCLSPPPKRPTRPRSRRSTPPLMRELERVIMLRVVDEYWMDHIDAMDDLKQGVRPAGLRQQQPRGRLQAGIPGDVRGNGLRHPG